MNYWNTKQIHWHDFSPESIFIKRNKISSQFEDEIQTASYTTKGSFINVLTDNPHGKGGWQNHLPKAVGVCVRLHSFKTDFPCAEIDFVKYNIKKQYSNGANKWTSPNAIAYITSNHQHGEYKRDAQGNWVMHYDPNVATDGEGYQVHFSANQSQYGGDRRECQEMLDISWAVVDFLIEKVLPCQRNALTMFA